MHLLAVLPLTCCSKTAPHKISSFSPQHPPASSCSFTCCSLASGWSVCCTLSGGSLTMTLLLGEAAGCPSCVASDFGNICGITSPSRWETAFRQLLYMAYISITMHTVYAHSANWQLYSPRSQDISHVQFILSNLWSPATLSVLGSKWNTDGWHPCVPYSRVLYMHILNLTVVWVNTVLMALAMCIGNNHAFLLTLLFHHRFVTWVNTIPISVCLIWNWSQETVSSA